MDGEWGGMGEDVGLGKNEGYGEKAVPFCSGIYDCCKQAIMPNKKRENQKAHSALEIFMV